MSGKKKNTTQETSIPKEGLLRIPQILEILPISKSGWWKGVKTGRFPKGIKVSTNVTCWDAGEVWALVENLKTGRVA